jgi:hypothetical protein
VTATAERLQPPGTGLWQLLVSAAGVQQWVLHKTVSVCGQHQADSLKMVGTLLSRTDDGYVIAQLRH